MNARARLVLALASTLTGCAVGSIETDHDADGVVSPDPMDARHDTGSTPLADGPRDTARPAADTMLAHDAVTGTDVATSIDAAVPDVIRVVDSTVPIDVRADVVIRPDTAIPPDVTPPRDVTVGPDVIVAPDVVAPRDVVVAVPDVVVPPDVGCPDSRVLCSGTCVDLATDVRNCGACGNACASCASGHCAVGGYTVIASSPQGWIDACSPRGSVHLTAAYQSTAAPRLPFAFTYWGTVFPAQTVVTVSSSGWIAFEPNDYGSVEYGDLPSTDPPNGTIAAYWDDLYLGETGAATCYLTTGNAPSRTFVAEWLAAKYLGPYANMTFEIVLTESTNTIDLRYQRMDRAASALTGLESPDGTQAVSQCGASSTSCTMGVGSFRFTPR